MNFFSLENASTFKIASMILHNISLTVKNDDGSLDVGTYIMPPGNLMMLRIGTNFAFEVHVVAFFYVLRIQGATQMQLHLRRNYRKFSPF